MLINRLHLYWHRFINYVAYFFRFNFRGDKEFVKEVCTEMNNKEQSYEAFGSLNKEYTHFLKINDSVCIKDFGAGSSVLSGEERKIKAIARTSLKSKSEYQKIFRLLKALNPTKIMELGTSLGLGTAYLSMASQKTSDIVTIEGCPDIARFAQRYWAKKLNNVTFVEGNIDEVLEKELQALQEVDVFLFDANHRYEPTIRYFHTCLPYIHKNAVFILDDIYWSPEMTKAWKELQNHPKTIASYDGYHMGILWV